MPTLVRLGKKGPDRQRGRHSMSQVRRVERFREGWGEESLECKVRV